jgi:hypothetical protein
VPGVQVTDFIEIKEQGGVGVSGNLPLWKVILSTNAESLMRLTRGVLGGINE